MRMYVLAKILAPRMQDHGDAEFARAAEPFGVSGEALECGGGALEEQIVEQARIRLRQCVERMGQREHDVEVLLDVEQLRLSGFDPALLAQGLALGATAISARMVPHSLNATVVTPCHVTTEQGSAAGFNVTHRAQLATRQMMSLPVGLAMGAKDVGDFEPLPCPVPDVSSGTHGLGLLIGVSAQAVKRRAGIPEMVLRQLEISQGGLDAVVA